MHLSVLLNETIAALAIAPGATCIDGTLGSAGHAAQMLLRAGPSGRLLGIDRDAEALARARDRLAAVPGEKILVQGEHGDILSLARQNGIEEADAVLLDLGVSSDQLDTPARGFSFRLDGPLDMRMGQGSGETAADLLARMTVEEMARLFRTWGEEPQAMRAARAIDRARRGQPVTGTLQLAGIVADALGGAKGKARHPATRVFQALRMAVNHEMADLEAALRGGLTLLKPGGRFAVITFESLTDRAVKQFFKAHEGRFEALQQGGERWQGEEPPIRNLLKHALTASESELAENPRSRSARLRAVERLAEIPSRSRHPSTGKENRHEKK